MCSIKDATKLDWDKTVAKCTYEVHKATIDTTHPAAPTRAFTSSQYYQTSDPAMNLNNAAIGLSNTLSQMSAARKDRINEENRKIQLSSDRKLLYDECLKADGFINIYSADKRSLSLIEKTCPNQDNGINPCLVN